jgi:signal transduction histidine kinase
MKSINAKITIILIIGLLCQVLLSGTFYQLALTKKIIYEINTNANTREKMLNDVSMDIEKFGNNLPRIQSFLLRYSQDNSIDFMLKDIEGNIKYVTTYTINMSKKIEGRGVIEFKNKPTYLVYAYFPTKIENLLASVQGNDTKLLLALIVGVIAIIISFIIYLIIGAPLKKLRNAMGDIDYGNTEVTIPYIANDEIGLLCRNIEEMGRRLKKSENNQNQLIQAISHDLKTPLTSVLGYINRLNDGKVTTDEKRREYYEIVKRKAYDLKYLIDELEDFSKLFKDDKNTTERVDINKFFHDIAFELEHEALQRGREFSYTNKININASFIIDEAKLRRVFTNVVGNSLKYAGETAKISMECFIQNKKVFFQICDNGVGVEESELDKIFNRFYRVETSRSRDMGGTGLGLAICRDIIEAHGGEIYARNHEMGGLCIEFNIPLIQD